MDLFRIRLLGEVSIAYQGKQVQNTDNRSRKVWLLLAYMIYFRKTTVSTQELIDLLWSDDEGSSNPANALKTIFHRLRATLDQLGEGVGHRLIVRRDGGYAFNQEVEITLDIVDFEAACQTGKRAETPELRLAAYQTAVELYRGDFLPKFSGESWVIPVHAYYHTLYVKTVYETLELLAEAQHSDRVIWLCRRAIELEPYDETLYAHLIRHLLNAGEQQSAVLVFESLSQVLFSQFGVTPSEELRALHREALRSTGEAKLDLQSITQDMLKQVADPGALYCEYDFFKVVYNAESRAVVRNGTAVHLSLLSVTAANGGPLPKRSLDRCMDNLQVLLCQLLRRGDIVSRCSSSQFVLLLPNANYENSCQVVERIIHRFGRQYPHSPAYLRYSVQPLLPT